MMVIVPSYLCGIEMYNGGTDCFRNQLAEIYAGHHKKSKTSGSDFHKPMHLAKGGICAHREIKKPRLNFYFKKRRILFNKIKLIQVIVR